MYGYSFEAMRKPELVYQLCKNCDIYVSKETRMSLLLPGNYLQDGPFVVSPLTIDNDTSLWRAKGAEGATFESGFC